jgi:PAS domain S-box-containing protein
MAMRTYLRALRPVDIAVAMYSVAYLAWMLVRTPGTPTTELIGSVAFYPAGLTVAWAYWRTSSLPSLDARTRAAWLLLAASALLLFVSGTAWDIYLHAIGRDEPLPWADTLELASSLAIVAAYLAFPGRPFAGRNRTRMILDASLVVVAGSAVAMYFAGRLWVADPSQQSFSTAVRGPGLDWLVFVVAAVGTVQKRDRTTRQALAPLVLGGVFYMIANYYYAVGPDLRGIAAYRPGDRVDVLWFLAWVCRWVAARWPVYSQVAGAAPTRAADQAVPVAEDGGLPYLVVVGSFVLLTTQVFSTDPSFGLLAVSAAITTALMMTRHVVELRENRRLLDEQTAQETRLRSFVEHSSDAVLIVDTRGLVTYASATTLDVVGAPGSAAVGARLGDLVREDDRPVLEAALAGHGGSGRLLLHVPGADGAWNEIEAVWVDRRHDPAVDGIVVNCRDVTHRRELERQLQHAQKLDAVGQLAGGLAHDINNALAIVRGYAELLKEELPADSPEVGDLAHIQLAVDRASAITRKVLAFSRRQVSQPMVLDLSAVVADLDPLLRQSLTPKIDLRLELARPLWTIRTDRGQMEQVLLNLATNARDAMPEGGAVTVTTSNRRVEADRAAAAGVEPGDYVALVVRDQGAGMTAEVRARIFEPFFSTKASTGGMGLGLAMVYDIVRESRGRIDVNSTVGEGAAFTILFPRTHDAVSVPTGGARSAAPVVGRTVLLVDDEENVRVVARRMLERHGYSVIEANGGSAALATVADASVSLDALLTDLVMPGIDGRELIVRCAAIRPALPVVCMTGFAGEQDSPLGGVGRRVAMLSKPFSQEGLLEAVNAAVARSAQR